MTKHLAGCRGSTLLKKRQFKYAMFDYWKLTGIKAREYSQSFLHIPHVQKANLTARPMMIQ